MPKPNIYQTKTCQCLNIILYLQFGICGILFFILFKKILNYSFFCHNRVHVDNNNFCENEKRKDVM